jgi:uncharacterized membrane protein YfcA
LTLAAVIAVIALATLVRSTFGFGEALIAVPLLAFVIPVKVAAPVAALVSVTVAAVVVIQDWRHVHMGSAAWLIVSTVVGIPLGLLLLTRVAEPVVKAGLAAVIIGFAIQALRSPGWHLENDRWAWLFGFVAGVLGGAYGMNGPPLAMYGSLRRWSPAEFRATLQGYFLPASAVGAAGYWLAGLWTPTVTRLYLASLPVVVIAIVAGRTLNRRIKSERFSSVVYAGLVVVGVILLLTLL